METGQFSDERRNAQFDILKDAQERALNLQYWQDFMNCIRTAGFRSAKMISSNNNLLFSYILYLIGLTEYQLDKFTLRKVIAQWFFMSAVTARYKASSESAMEFDLARLREVPGPDSFVNMLQYVCNIALINDFWEMTLPNNLATSSTSSPSLLAFNAALVLPDARVLFSSMKVVELIDPVVRAGRSPIERHHLFPKGYLEKQGITDTRDTNQIGNYAYVESTDNLKISDKAPTEYVPMLAERFNEEELMQMYFWHALPNDWEQMEYHDFLGRQRELMAKVIQKGYQTLLTGSESERSLSEFDVAAIIDGGESEAVEFKSTLRINLHTEKPDKRMEAAVLKTLAVFLNTNGGTLIVGVADDGTSVGIDADKFPNEDKMSLHLVNVIKERLGPLVMTTINLHFEDHEEARVLVVRCQRSIRPVFVKDGRAERFYIRTGPATTELSAHQIHDYIKQRFER